MNTDDSDSKSIILDLADGKLYHMQGIPPRGKGMSSPSYGKARLLPFGLADRQLRDAAMQGQVDKNTGGIDLTPAKGLLQTQNDGEGIKFHLNPAMLAQLQNTSGFTIGSITIQPLKSLEGFLEINHHL